MPDRANFTAAAEELAHAFERRTSLYEPFLRVLPITGASVSTLGPTFGSQTVSASDAEAARIDELQFDLGEGPCWQALVTRRPVLSNDVQRMVQPQWPIFAQALDGSPAAALYAFPLTLGSLDIGAVDLYAEKPGSLTDEQVMDATILAGIAARQVLRRALSENDLDPSQDDEQGFSRRVIHQATGMVLAQLNISADDATLIIHGHAYSSGRTVREVAADIVSRRLDFAADLPGS